MFSIRQNQVYISTSTHSISNNKVFALDGATWGPRSGWSGFNEFRWFTFQLRIFFDAFQSNLRKVNWVLTAEHLSHSDRPLTAPNQRIAEPNWKCMWAAVVWPWRKTSTMNNKSPVIVEANARAKPAKDADMLGVTRHTNPVAPTIAADTRLNRTDSHRLTRKRVNKSKIVEIDVHLPTSSSMGSNSIECQLCRHWQRQNTHRIDTSQHVPQEFGRGAESTDNSDPRNGLSVNGI